MTLKNILRELDRLKREKISVPIEFDELGYLDRECPAPSCLFVFKVLAQDWTDRFKDEAVFCPLCGHEAAADKWWTTEQITRAREEAMTLLRGRIGNALHRDARDFNATAPRGFVRMSMKVSGTGHARTAAIPVAAAAVLEQTLTCDRCGAGYAVVGSAFFCPCCGHNSVERMFDGSLTKVRTKIERLDVVREALRIAVGADQAEVFCRSTIENGLQDCVVAFQHLAERLYSAPVGSKPPAPNVFQRLDGGSDVWRATIGEGYEDWLTPVELQELRVLFQRRHLLAHREGLIDAKYLQKSGDTTYRIGQRLVVSAADVFRMVVLVKKLGTALRTALTTHP